MYECVDYAQESPQGIQANENEALFYHVEVGYVLLTQNFWRSPVWCAPFKGSQEKKRETARTVIEL